MKHFIFVMLFSVTAYTESYNGTYPFACSTTGECEMRYAQRIKVQTLVNGAEGPWTLISIVKYKEKNGEIKDLMFYRKDSNGFTELDSPNFFDKSTAKPLSKERALIDLVNKYQYEIVDHVKAYADLKES